MTSGERPQPFESLTGLRFIAAFWVVLYHYGDDLLPWGWAARIVHGGYSAVSMFFVLSGFVLTYNYAEAFERRTTTRRRFWLARAARVYPLYLFLVPLEVLLLLVALRGNQPRVVLPAAVAHVFLLQSWMAVFVEPGNVPGWTIGNEAFFYLIFPWLVLRLYRSPRRSTVLLTVIAVWALGMAIAGAVVLTHASESAQAAWRVLPVARCHEFAVGIGTARLWMLDRERGARVDGTWFSVPSIVLIATLTSLEPEIPYALFHNGALALLYAALIYGLAHGGAPSRLLETRPLVALGEASYAVYLVQQPVFLALVALGAPLESVRVRIAFFGLLLVVSFVAHHGLERPLQRRIRQGPWGLSAEQPDRARDLLWLLLPAGVALTLVPFGYPNWRGTVPGTVLGATVTAGVEEQGFYGEEADAGGAYRWTNGDAVLRVPLRRDSARRLYLSVESGNPRGVDLEVLVNGQPRFASRIPNVGWSATLDLDGKGVSGVVTIEIRSSTFVPARDFSGSEDSRVLGVRVYAVKLE